MRVIGHLTIGPDLDPEFRARLGNPVAIERIIVVGEEDALAAIAAMRNVMWDAGQDTRFKASGLGSAGAPPESAILSGLAHPISASPSVVRFHRKTHSRGFAARW